MLPRSLKSVHSQLLPLLDCRCWLYCSCSRAPSESSSSALGSLRYIGHRCGNMDTSPLLSEHSSTTCRRCVHKAPAPWRSEEHTSELQSLMRISYAVFCLK